MKSAERPLHWVGDTNKTLINLLILAQVAKLSHEGLDYPIRRAGSWEYLGGSWREVTPKLFAILITFREN